MRSDPGRAGLRLAAFRTDAPMNGGRSRVLVTGGAGFVGRACVESLMEAGYAVRRLLRATSEPIPGVQDVVSGDLVDLVEWSPILENVEVVVHLAARVHVLRETVRDPRAAFRQVNVEVTRRLAAEAARVGVRRFVFLSSVKVQGERSHGRPLSERDPPAPENPYGESKRDAEAALDEIAAATGLDVVTLRPPLVYGPGVGGNLLMLMRAVELGMPLPFGAVENRRSLVAVRNLADAITRICFTDRRLGRIYGVTDGTPMSTPQLIRLLAEGIGRRPRLLSVPVGWLVTMARWMGRHDDMQRLTGSFEIDDSALRADLDWSPPAVPGTELIATGRAFAGRR